MTAGSAVVVRDAAAINAAFSGGFSRQLLEAGACEALLAALLGRLLEAIACVALLAAHLMAAPDAGACEASLALLLGAAARDRGSQALLAERAYESASGSCSDCE